MSYVKHHWYLKVFLLALMVVPAVWWLFKTGFYQSDDADWMIIRFSSFYQELGNGQIPVRYLNRLNNGYGYPVATFLYPGFMYLASVFKIVGFGYIASVKAVFIVSVVSALFFSYLWLRQRFRLSASVLGALAYVYHPYFLYDIYKRGSVGEVLSLGILPLALLGIEKRNAMIISLSYAGLIISHNTLALVFIPLLIGYQLVNGFNNKKAQVEYAISTVVGIGIASFFWIPALFELKYTIFSETTVSNWLKYFVSLSSLWQLGSIQLIAFFTIILMVFMKKDKIKPVTIYMLAVFGIGAILALPLSTILWQTLPFGTLVQFPFRFLSLTIVGGSFLLSYLLDRLNMKWVYVGSVSILLLSSIYALNFIKPTLTPDRTDEYYITNEATTTVQDEYMPKWVNAKPPDHPRKKVMRIDKDFVQINTIYWPGFNVQVDGRRVPIDYKNEYGLIRVPSISDDDKIDVRFGETPIRMMADAISIFSLILLAVLWRMKNE